jgi:transposase
LEWPGNSPDLNPIEHLWAIMKGKLRRRRPSSIPELKQIISDIWNNEITQNYLKSLFMSMPRRLQAVIDANGGHTKY